MSQFGGVQYHLNIMKKIYIIKTFFHHCFIFLVFEKVKLKKVKCLYSYLMNFYEFVDQLTKKHF